MSTVSIAMVEGGWVVTAETKTAGQLQRYHCPTLPLAQRWASILGAPRRETSARAAQPREDEELSYTITWVGPPEVAGTR